MDPELGNLQIDYVCAHCGLDHQSAQHETVMAEQEKTIPEEAFDLALYLRGICGDSHSLCMRRGDALVVMADFAWARNRQKNRQNVLLELSNNPDFANVHYDSGEITADLKKPKGPIKKIIVAITKAAA